MGSAFDSEFADALAQFGGTPYRPVARIAGGTGRTTFLAFAPDGRASAIRFAPDSALGTARFRMEGVGELINTLASPRFPRRFDAGVADARSWVAAEYIPAPSLREAVHAYGPLSREGVRHLAQGLAEAFTALHRVELTGRGLEAGDVVLGRTGPVIVDPGIIRVEGADGRIAAGSEKESWSRSVADDVRAIAALLYYAATGLPASSASSDILSPAVGHCPSALREAIEAGLRVRPQARPSLAALAAAANEGAVAASLAAHWLEEPWQSPDVLREIDERAQDVARLRMRLLDRDMTAAATPRSGRARRLAKRAAPGGLGR